MCKRSMNAIAWTALGIALVVAAGIGLIAFGNSSWRGSTQVQMAKLEATRISAIPGRYDAREIEGLPPPVQRYFRAVLKDGQRFIAAANFELAGKINMSATGENWKPFTSTQRAVTHRPGFLWNGRVAFMPALSHMCTTATSPVLARCTPRCWVCSLYRWTSPPASALEWNPACARR